MHWLLSAEQAPQPLENFDTAWLYGYSAYTTFRWPLAERWLEAHLERLATNAQALDVALSLGSVQWPELLSTLVTPERPVIRLAVLPEIDSYGDFYAKTGFSGRLIMTTRPLPPPPGRKLILASACYERPFPEIKLGGMAESILLKRQARNQGADDVLFINQAGCFSEASTANVFFIQGDTLLTPDPAQDGCLPGITRLQVLEAAAGLGLRTAVGYPVTPESLKTLDGAFLANAVSGLQPVERVNDVEFPWTASALDVAVRLSAALR